jgi:hypothetical protein
MSNDEFEKKNSIKDAEKRPNLNRAQSWGHDYLFGR